MALVIFLGPDDDGIMMHSSWRLPLFASLLLASCAVGSAPPSAAPASVAPSPSTSTTPSPSLVASPEPSSPDLAVGLPYYCGNGEIFHIESLSGPPAATDGSDPAAALVPSLAAQFGFSATHWWPVFRSSTRAEFIGMDAVTSGYDYVLLSFDGGSWTFTSIGGCGPTYLVRGRDTIAWWLDPTKMPTPGAVKLQVLARDLCPPTFADRVAKPVIRYGTDSILIVLTAKDPFPPMGQPYTGPPCGDSQTAQFTVTLDTPLGTRTLVDGSRWPARSSLVVPPMIGISGG
jgi:hypothetical protein